MAYHQANLAQMQAAIQNHHYQPVGHQLNPQVWNTPQWNQPTTLPEAKKMIGHFRAGKTKAARNNDSHPKEKYASVIKTAHLVWSGIDKEIAADLITNGRANAKHFCLLHNPTGLPNGETDQQAIDRKKARYTIARTMVKSRYADWIKQDALEIWIDEFLPSYDRDTFTAHQLAWLKTRLF